ncbi:MAG: T9SS type A sorting domain-containing protein, partial [Bacteroidota bacterium]
LGYVNTGGNLGTVSGGTLQIGNSSTAANQNIQVNTSMPIYDLLIGDAVAVNASLNTNSLTVKNNVVINTGTLSANAIHLTLGNIWNNSGNFSAGTASVVFNGSVTQQIRGTSTTTFNNISIINTGSGALSLSSPAFVSGALNLSNGKVFSDASNFITMMAGSTINSGNSNAFIDGPISKTGTTAFTFPVGSGTKWARIGIGAPTSSSTFKAQYFASAYSNTANIATSPTPALHHVSTKEYWQLERSAGTGSATVTLFWEDAANSGIFDCTTYDLRVAHWDVVGSNWENASETVNTGGSCVGASSGSISTTTALGNFSPFTFGSKGLANNPLPITLLYFTASQYINQVTLNWSTATEKNCDCFVIQKSLDGIHFTSLGMVKGAGNCSTKRDYHFNDLNPSPGIAYYRLKQMDFDKNFDYSNVELLEFKISLETNVFPNPNASNQLNIYLKDYYSESILFSIFDSYGRLILSKNLPNNLQDKNYQAELIFDSKLSPGVYFIKAKNEEELFTKKLFIEAH